MLLCYIILHLTAEKEEQFPSSVHISMIFLVLTISVFKSSSLCALLFTMKRFFSTIHHLSIIWVKTEVQIEPYNPDVTFWLVNKTHIRAFILCSLNVKQLGTLLSGCNYWICTYACVWYISDAVPEISEVRTYDGYGELYMWHDLSDFGSWIQFNSIQIFL